MQIAELPGVAAPPRLALYVAAAFISLSGVGGLWLGFSGIQPSHLPADQNGIFPTIDATNATPLSLSSLDPQVEAPPPPSAAPAAAKPKSSSRAAPASDASADDGPVNDDAAAEGKAAKPVKGAQEPDFDHAIDDLPVSSSAPPQLY